jgi:tRNA(Ile)-lysidine synthetase-like protein
MQAVDFVNEWFKHEEWWFAGDNEIDKYLIKTFGHLLKIPIDELSPLEAILINDQLLKHYRNGYSDGNGDGVGGGDGVNDIDRQQKTITLSLKHKDSDIWTPIEWTFIMLPLRHSLTPHLYRTVMLDAWARLCSSKNATDVAVYKRFLKATFQRATPVHIANQIPWIITLNTTANTNPVIPPWTNNSILDYAPTEYPPSVSTSKDSDIISLCRPDIISHQRILISLSGGVDSMVALFAIRTTCPNIQIAAVYIDYHNRNECAEEILFLTEWCTYLAIPLYCRSILEIQRADAKLFELRDMYESYTRDVRYNTYKCVWQYFLQWPGDPIVVMGHNRDDCLENIMTNMTHQYKYDELEGMKKETYQGGNCFLRPLLTVSKAEIYAFARANSIPYLCNSTPKWSQRGKIRGYVVPALETWDPRSIVGLHAWASTTASLYSTLRSHVAMCLSAFDTENCAVFAIDAIDTSPMFWKELYQQLCKSNRHFAHNASMKGLANWDSTLTRFKTAWDSRHMKHKYKCVLNPACIIEYYKHSATHIWIHVIFVSKIQ